MKTILRSTMADAMQLCGITTALRSWNRNRLVVLCYHRVLPEPRRAAYAFPDLAVTPEAFEEHVAFARRHYDCLPLSEAHDRLRRVARPRRPMLSFTFDDGYGDNHEWAHPILRRHDVRATFYVISGLVDSADPPWYDRLARSWPEASAQHQTNGRSGGQPAQDEADRWLAEQLHRPGGTSPQRVVQEAKRLRPQIRQQVLERVEARASATRQTIDRMDRIMTAAALKALSASGHEIGAHSKTHPLLTQLDDRALKEELVASRESLGALTAAPVRSLAYPNGDHDERVRAAVRLAGYDNAVTTLSGLVRADADAFQLPRLFIAQQRLSRPDGRASDSLLALELTGAADRIYFRRKNQVPVEASAHASSSRNRHAATTTTFPVTTATSTPKLAWLVSRYPAVSHTFIQREVLALRRQGLSVDTFTVRPTPSAELLTDLDREEARRTFSVLPVSAWRLLRDHLTMMAAHPGRYVTTLWHALRHRTPGLRSALWSFFYFAEAVVLAAELRRRGITHLHAHFANVASEVGSLAARLMNIPWSMTIHGLADFGDPSRSRLADKIAQAAFVICVSDYGRAQAMLHSGAAHGSKLHVIRCGIDTERFPPPQRPSADRDPGALRLLCVARLGREKGHPILFDALHMLNASAPAGLEIHLDLVGDGPERARLEQLAHEKDLQDRVRFHGSVGQDRIQAFYEQADIFVLPSLAEGLPVVLMEAMAKQLPVIASGIMGIPELVEHGVHGLLVPPGRAEPLAEAIRRLAEDQALSESMGRAGREKVCAEFDIRRSEPLLAALFGPQGASSSPESRESIEPPHPRRPHREVSAIVTERNPA